MYNKRKKRICTHQFELGEAVGGGARLGQRGGQRNGARVAQRALIQRQNAQRAIRLARTRHTTMTQGVAR